MESRRVHREGGRYGLNFEASLFQARLPAYQTPTTKSFLLGVGAGVDIVESSLR